MMKKNISKLTKYRAIIIIIFIICSHYFSEITVYAGEVNGNEASIVAVARGTFTVDGKKYQATASSINTLISYLSRDDVDLTASQASKAIGMIYANLENGVNSGYLVPVDSGTSHNSSNDNNDSNKSGTDEKNSNKDNSGSNDSDKDSSKNDSNSADDMDDVSNDSNMNDNNPNGYHSDDKSTNEDSSSSDVNNENNTSKENNSDDFFNPEKIFQNNNFAKIKIDEEKSEFSVENNNKLIYTDKLVIKDTGFNLLDTIIVLTVFFIVFFSTIYFTKKYQRSSK